jgi:transcriptional regulator with XRE-family HTH domain
MDKKILGQVINELRMKRGYTQQKLADHAKKNRVYISYLENGHQSMLLGTLFDVAKGLGVKPSEILKRVEARM